MESKKKTNLLKASNFFSSDCYLLKKPPLLNVDFQLETECVLSWFRLGRSGYPYLWYISLSLWTVRPQAHSTKNVQKVEKSWAKLIPPWWGEMSLTLSHRIPQSSKCHTLHTMPSYTYHLTLKPLTCRQFGEK